MPSALSQAIMFNQRAPLSGTHRSGNISNSNFTSASISGIAVGSDPSPYRTVVVVSQANATITGLLVNGASIPSSQIIYNTDSTQALGWVVVPSGTTCSIGGTYQFAGNYRHLYSYTMLDGFRMLHDYKEGSSVTLGLPGGESYIVGIGGGTTTNPTWTNLTSRQTVLSSSSSIYSEAASDFVTTGTSRSISISDGTFLVASFR